MDVQAARAAACAEFEYRVFNLQGLSDKCNKHMHSGKVRIL